MTNISLPDQWGLFCGVAGNTVRQLRRRSMSGDAAVLTLALSQKQTGFRVEIQGRSIAVVGKALPDLPEGEVLLCRRDGKVALPASDVGKVQWLRPSAVTGCTPTELRDRADAVRTSWIDKFELRMETDATKGLREPQVGALHALLAHWTMSEEAATIVMPTGSGKTETMMSAVVAERLENVLVVVPSVALREQTVEKFARLGVLPALGIVRGGDFPIIGVLEHGIEGAADAEAFVRSANVVVATMAAINACSTDARAAIAKATTNLFIDEAHHIPADTWAAFRMHFPTSRVVQFTATPFRNDGKRVDGRHIYDYPLARAQANGMFQEIRFTAVAAFTAGDADLRIARETKAQLDRDLAAGFDHLAMARHVQSTVRKRSSRSTAPSHRSTRRRSSIVKCRRRSDGGHSRRSEAAPHGSSFA